MPYYLTAMEPAQAASTNSHHGTHSSSPYGASFFEKTYAKLFNEPSCTDSDEELVAAEEGRHSWLKPKLDISSSPRIYWQAFQAMRQVGQTETRRMSEAEVRQLCSSKVS